MPCRDGDWDEPRVIKRFEMDIHDFEAVLCGLFTEAESRGLRTGYDELSFLLSEVNWKEVGVPRKKVENWWAGHKREDERRRKKEAEEKRKAELKAAALSKLTDEEKQVLGIL
jgi:hypothetical protein